ncbi:MAG: ABC-F family ATP-binding cassette domain-containing protein [Ignavibacteriae bacterium]|nr:ABC transporter ATP-binding protein [Ignavibacteriota bacterium]NOG96329.1 ABC-F family ATP-binding cassette domain-containing protein [Ignavibacteriota bacterium]
MIDLVNLTIQFGDRILFEDVNLKINPLDRICLVGSNGSGKSTLLKVIAGMDEAESGSVQKQKNLRIGYLPQEFIAFSGRSLFDEVKSTMKELIFLQKREDEINELLSDDRNLSSNEDALLHELGEIQHKKEGSGFYSADSKIEKVLTGLGFSISDFSKDVGTFSGGWQMRVHLAKILLVENDIILLDEPTNHLDIESLEWLIDYLKSYKSALIIVSHDKHFVNSVTNKTIEIFNKKLIFYRGNYNDYLKFKSEREIQLKAQFEYQQKKIKETEKFIERFRYKATKAKQVQSRIKQLEKLDSIQLFENEKEISLRFPSPPKSSALPINLVDVSKSFADKKVLDNINLKIERGEKIAFLGPNGAGKTTLAKIIAGKLNVTSGKVEIGNNTFISYYAQEAAEELNLENTIFEEASASSEEATPVQIRTLLGSFLFSDDDVFKKVGVLSGGEKSRLALSKILLTKANVVILDEPTNHLDVSSKAVLQNALIQFTGSLIIVSHDVDFLKPIAAKVIEVKNHTIKIYHGDIDYFLFKRNEEAPQALYDRQDEISSTKLTRKDEKRIEAELRQKKFKATKTLTDDLNKAELKIEELELRKSELEVLLNDENLYNDSEKIKQVTTEYETVKSELQQLYSQWDEMSEKLEAIESEFKL